MTTAPLLVVRADAATAIGVGHVMRTLAVAQAWRLAAGRVLYAACALPDTLQDRLDVEGCRLERWQDIEPGSMEDARRLRELVERNDAAAVLIDGYAFGERFRREVSETRARSMLVHDYQFSEPLWVQFLLNQNPHARPDHYPRVDTQRTLLGLRWALLRTEFVGAPGLVGCAPWAAPPGGDGGNGDESRVSRVLVTLGGADPHDVTSRVLRALETVVSPLDVGVVVGAANPHLDGVRQLAERSRHVVRVLRDMTNMPELMAWSDLAVGAAGSTSWELAWMGVPAICIAIADNQRPILDELRMRGMAVSLGWHGDVAEEDIADAARALIARPEERQRMRARMRRAVDGAGATRVAALLRGYG